MDVRITECSLCDGASWIWKHVASLFPSARQVLDYYHCKEYLHKVAKVQYASPERALEWVEATLARLYLGKVGVGPGWVETHAARPLKKRSKRLTIAGCISRPIGTGRAMGSFVAGAIRLAVVGLNRRTNSFVMCGSSALGAWWYEGNSNEMLALRCAKYNGTFDRVFERHRQRLRKT